MERVALAGARVVPREKAAQVEPDAVRQWLFRPS
ncbi:MAG: hypothetical protein BWY06_01555 [Candidatus Latescibacteria bacterium ADurb.Bin168]|nr:MAG: hypothetical protein BWY06_01555 [Candidatus Latescibacteria bacterium ADurb.Bin168]